MSALQGCRQFRRQLARRYKSLCHCYMTLLGNNDHGQDWQIFPTMCTDTRSKRSKGGVVEDDLAFPSIPTQTIDATPDMPVLSVASARGRCTQKNRPRSCWSIWDCRTAPVLTSSALSGFQFCSGHRKDGRLVYKKRQCQ